jgi:hypothetical protein
VRLEWMKRGWMREFLKVSQEVERVIKAHTEMAGSIWAGTSPSNSGFGTGLLS